MTKFAFVMPACFANTMENGGTEASGDPAVFKTAWFARRDNALSWFVEA